MGRNKTHKLKRSVDSLGRIRGDLLHLFQRLFVIGLGNNRDCDITMPISLKTMEVQIYGIDEIRGAD